MATLVADPAANDCDADAEPDAVVTAATVRPEISVEVAVGVNCPLAVV
jgi:hypothetical protein